MATRINLEEFRARQEDADGLDIDLPDGTSVHVPPPMLWSDEVVTMARGGFDNLDLVEFSSAVLGADYPRFLAAGGTGAALFAMLMEAHNGPAGGLGESSASSSSSENTARPSKPTSSASTASTSSTSAPAASPGAG